MALFTGRGDDGTTTTFRKNHEMSKGSRLAEALGTIDEINSLLGVSKTKAQHVDLVVYEGGPGVAEVIEKAQRDLFIVQAELGGDDKTIVQKKIDDMEETIERIEDSLPEIDSFFVAGGTELSGFLDLARAVARRAERRVVEANHAASGELVSEETLAFLNRLSSLLYALVRRANFAAGVSEKSPDYK